MEAWSSLMEEYVKKVCVTFDGRDFATGFMGVKCFQRET